MTDPKYIDDIDVMNQMRSDKRKGDKSGANKHRKVIRKKNVDRLRSDKRKGDRSSPNKHCKKRVRLVKKELHEDVDEPKVVKMRKKRVETKPRKTKYSGLTAEEKKIAYRSSKEKRKEMYARHIDKHREERKSYYHANKERILEQQRQKRREKAIAAGRNGTQIGRPRKY